MPGNSMLGSTYLSPLKTQVISHNVKTIISKKYSMMVWLKLVAFAKAALIQEAG